MGQIYKNNKKQDFLKKILIVGTGEIAQRHYRNILKLNKKFQIDFFTRRKKKITNKKLKNINYINNFNKAVNTNYFAAILCNPAPYRLKFAIPLAKNGTNLYLEKPVSSGDIMDSIFLLKLCKKKKITLQVGYNLLYLNSLNYLKSLIIKKIFGKIKIVKVNAGYYLPFWRKKDYKNSVSSKKKLGGGVLLELSHEFNYLIWLFGLPSYIFANIGKISDLNVDVEDFANIIFKFKKDITSSCNLDFINKDYTRKLEIIADRGNIVWDYKNNTVIEKKFFLNSLKNKIKKTKFKKNDTYSQSLVNFLNLCKTKKVDKNVFNAINTNRIVNYAKKSAKLNKSIVLRKKDFSI